MHTQFNARRLDLRRFAQEGGSLEGGEPVRQHERLLAETQGRGGDSAVSWSATGELRNPRHIHPEIWLHLRADAVLSLTCQRCLAPVDVPLAVERSFRFVDDEEMAAAQDELAEEDVLALSRGFDLAELIEDELLMEMPLAPRHDTCPAPLNARVSDEAFDEGPPSRDNPFGVLGKLKIGKATGQ